MRVSPMHTTAARALGAALGAALAGLPVSTPGPTQDSVLGGGGGGGGGGGAGPAMEPDGAVSTDPGTPAFLSFEVNWGANPAALRAKMAWSVGGDFPYLRLACGLFIDARDPATGRMTAELYVRGHIGGGPQQTVVRAPPPPHTHTHAHTRTHTHTHTHARTHTQHTRIRFTCTHCARMW